MHVLLTNDDGITAPGLAELRRGLSRPPELRVSVVAPDRERSAVGHAITLHKPLRVQRVDLDGAAGWSVSGTPADCTKLAILALLSDPPDLVISGINNGYNLASDVLYSGTVSAAMEGVMMGVPAIAVSVSGTAGSDELARASSFMVELVDMFAQGGFPSDMLLNVNVPPRGRQGGEVVLTRLGRPRYKDVFHRRVDPRGQTYYWMAGTGDHDLVEGTDIWAVAQGAISVTPLHFDLTSYDELEALAPRFNLER